MILVLLGDLHIRSSNPENRIDDYQEAIWTKLGHIFNKRYDELAAILQPGDFFDGPVQPNALLSRCFDEMKHDTGLPMIHTVFGQHDMKYRTKGNTALDVLIAGEIVQNTAVCELTEHVKLYSCSWVEDIPEIKNRDDFNVLLIHKMIVEEKLWEGQTEHTWANTLLRQTKFDLIVSGDNHQSFVMEHKNKLLVNCGSLMRTNKNQIDHKPMFVIYNTETRRYGTYYIPVKPAEEVFDMKMLEREKEKDEKLAAFVSGLTDGVEIGLDFKANLFAAIEANGVTESVETIIKEAMSNGN